MTKNVAGRIPATTVDPERAKYRKGIVSTVALMRIYVETLNKLKLHDRLTKNREDEIKITAGTCRKILIENFQVTEERVKTIWGMLDSVKIKDAVDGLYEMMSPSLLEIPGAARPDPNRKLIIPFLMVDQIVKKLKEDKEGRSREQTD